MPKYDISYKVHTLSDYAHIFTNKKIDRYEVCRWTYLKRFSSDDTKTDKKLTDVQQRIIELKEEKLGKLKERILDIEIKSNEKEKDKVTNLAEKQFVEFTKTSKNDVVSKKGNNKYYV